MCYNKAMESVKQIVAANLQALRKENGMTQAELAAKLNYSDKSVSKWENGESLPDIDVLCELAEMYGVTVDFLVKKGSAEEKINLRKKESDKINRIVVIALFVTTIWLIATAIFVYIYLRTGDFVWMTYVWAVPASFLVLGFSNKYLVGIKTHSIIFLSLFVWSLILSLCFQFMQYNIWPIIIIGIPVQTAIILLSKLKK